jgi:hypothetical protein
VKKNLQTRRRNNLGLREDWWRFLFTLTGACAVALVVLYVAWMIGVIVEALGASLA